MSDPIILRAASGASVGLGHVMRSRAVAQALARLGEPALLLVDDPATVRLFAGEGFEVSQADPEGHWLEAPAHAVWLDGFRPWTEDLDLKEEVAEAKEGVKTVQTIIILLMEHILYC